MLSGLHRAAREVDDRQPAPGAVQSRPRWSRSPIAPVGLLAASPGYHRRRRTCRAASTAAAFGCEPVDPGCTVVDRIAGRGIDAERCPIALAADLLVRDRALRGPRMNGSRSPGNGTPERLHEFIAASRRRAAGCRSPAAASLAARLAAGPRGSRLVALVAMATEVSVTTQQPETRRQPDDVDQLAFGVSARPGRTRRRRISASPECRLADGCLDYHRDLFAIAPTSASTRPPLGSTIPCNCASMLPCRCHSSPWPVTSPARASQARARVTLMAARRRPAGRAAGGSAVAAAGSRRARPCPSVRRDAITAAPAARQAAAVT